MVNLSEIFLGEMMLEVQSGVSVSRFGLDKNFFYIWGRDVVIGKM